MKKKYFSNSATYLYGMGVSPEMLEGGKADGMSPSQFSRDELERGMEEETEEHTSDPRVAREIVMDHLAEDRQYYSKAERSMAKEHGFKGVLGKGKGRNPADYSSGDSCPVCVSRKKRGPGRVHGYAGTFGGSLPGTQRFVPSHLPPLANEGGPCFEGGVRSGAGAPTKPAEYTIPKRGFDEHSSQAATIHGVSGAEGVPAAGLRGPENHESHGFLSSRVPRRPPTGY